MATDVKKEPVNAQTALTVALKPEKALRYEQGQLKETVRMGSIPRGQRQILKERLATVETDLAAINKVKRVVDAGYEPFTPNPHWIMGAATIDDVRRRRYEAENEIIRGGIALQTRRYFNAPMPPHALLAWKKARDSRLFDLFMVSSPDSNLFNSVRPRPIWTDDPVLIGFVRLNDRAQIFDFLGDSYRPGRTEGVQGFLIAQWDLDKDLALAETTEGAK